MHTHSSGLKLQIWLRQEAKYTLHRANARALFMYVILMQISYQQRGLFVYLLDKESMFKDGFQQGFKPPPCVSTGRGCQFLAQSPQSVLHREPEDSGWRKGPEARGGHSTEVAGKCCGQGSSRANGQHHGQFSWNDRRPGLFLSRWLILFSRNVCFH